MGVPATLTIIRRMNMNLQQIVQWYGPPGSRAASISRTDVALMGVSDETLLMTAAFLTRGQSVGVVNGRIAHRIISHPANSRVPHEQFNRGLGVPVPQLPAAEMWDDRGDKLYVLGWKLESLECFFRAIALDPECVGAWVNLSRYFMDPNVGDFSAAMICAEKAVKIDERCDMALANLGGIAFARGDLPAVIRYCARAAAINDNNFFAHYYHAGALMKAGDHSAAKKQEILRHALRCRELIAQCPVGRPAVEQTIAWCKG